MKLFEIQQQSLHVSGDFVCNDLHLMTLEGSCPSFIGGMFDCRGNHLTNLKGGPRTVRGDYVCVSNQLTSLEGVPRTIGGYFDCSFNKLTSLKHCPEIVGGHFFCRVNPIKSYHDVHKMIKQINGVFVCYKGTHMLGITQIRGVTEVWIEDDTKLSALFNQHLRDIHMLQDALIDAGYREQAQL